MVRAPVVTVADVAVARKVRGQVRALCQEIFDPLGQGFTLA